MPSIVAFLLTLLFAVPGTAWAAACPVAASVTWTSFGQDISSCAESADDDFTFADGVEVTIGGDIVLTTGSIIMASGSTFTFDVDTDAEADFIVTTNSDITFQSGSTLNLQGTCLTNEVSPVFQNLGVGGDKAFVHADCEFSVPGNIRMCTNDDCTGDPDRMMIAWDLVGAVTDAAYLQGIESALDAMTVSTGDEYQICFWDFTTNDWYVGADDNYCYQITAIDAGEPSISITFDTRMGDDDPTGATNLMRSIGEGVLNTNVRSSTAGTGTIGSDIIAVTNGGPSDTIVNSGELDGWWLYMEDGQDGDRVEFPPYLIIDSVVEVASDGGDWTCANPCAGTDAVDEGATAYTGTTESIYHIVIQAEGAPDVFLWWKDDGAVTDGVGVLASNTLAEGVIVEFDATDAQTIGDHFTIAVHPAVNTFRIAPKEVRQITGQGDLRRTYTEGDTVFVSPVGIVPGDSFFIQAVPKFLSDDGDQTDSDFIIDGTATINGLFMQNMGKFGPTTADQDYEFSHIWHQDCGNSRCFRFLGTEGMEFKLNHFICSGGDLDGGGNAGHCFAASGTAGTFAGADTVLLDYVYVSDGVSLYEGDDCLVVSETLGGVRLFEARRMDCLRATVEADSTQFFDSITNSISTIIEDGRCIACVSSASDGQLILLEDDDDWEAQGEGPPDHRFNGLLSIANQLSPVSPNEQADAYFKDFGSIRDDYGGVDSPPMPLKLDGFYVIDQAGNTIGLWTTTNGSMQWHNGVIVRPESDTNIAVSLVQKDPLTIDNVAIIDPENNDGGCGSDCVFWDFNGNTLTGDIMRRITIGWTDDQPTVGTADQLGFGRTNSSFTGIDPVISSYMIINAGSTNGSMRLGATNTPGGANELNFGTPAFCIQGETPARINHHAGNFDNWGAPGAQNGMIASAALGLLDSNSVNGMYVQPGTIGYEHGCGATKDAGIRSMRWAWIKSKLLPATLEGARYPKIVRSQDGTAY